MTPTAILPGWAVRAAREKATQVRLPIARKIARGAIAVETTAAAIRFLDAMRVWRRMPWPYRPGQPICVRETWAQGIGRIIYRADWGEPSKYEPDHYPAHPAATWLSDMQRTCGADVHKGGWQPASRMPRDASRLTIIPGEVRVERLQGMSHEDALACGSAGHDWVASSPYIAGPHTDTGVLPIEEYEATWDSTARPGERWADNPWTIVLDKIGAEWSDNPKQPKAR